MRNTSLKYILQQHKDKLIKTTATGLIGLMVANNFTACDKIAFPSQTTESTTDITEYETEHTTNCETITDIEIETNAQPVQRQHSDLYWEAKQQWGHLWNKDYDDMTNIQKFQLKCVPFTFLAEQGAVYYDTQGNAYAYGNEDFENNNCIQVRGFIDESSPETELYMLVQYVSAPVSDLTSDNDGAYVATYMLKYDLPQDVYKDILLYSGDMRLGSIISQMDKNFEPKVISKSIVEFDLIKQLGLFDKGLIFDWLGDYINYIEHIDYENLNLTITFNPNKSNRGQLYSYTFNLKETPMWERCIRSLENDGVYFPITQEERDKHTKEELMPTYQADVGEVLAGFCIDGRMICAPSDEQKATATQKCNFTRLGFASQGTKEKVDEYEKGKIEFDKVNTHTSNYAKEQDYHSGN